MSKNQDLRSFISEVRGLGPNFYQSVSRSIHPQYESCVIQQKLAVKNLYPILHFSEVYGSNQPMISNIFGSYDLLGLALGVLPGGDRSQVLKALDLINPQSCQTCGVVRRFLNR